MFRPFLKKNEYLQWKVTTTSPFLYGPGMSLLVSPRVSKKRPWQSVSERFNVDLLKGLGHAILGKFSTDQMVIELTKLSK